MDPRELARRAMNGEVSLLGTFIELTKALQTLEEAGFSINELKQELFEFTQEVGTIMPAPPGNPAIDPQVLRSIEEVVEYLFEDELKSFQEDMGIVDTDLWADNGLLAAAAWEPGSPKETHIFCSLARIRRWLP